MTKRICIGHFVEQDGQQIYQEPTISWTCDGCACRNLDDADDQPTTTTFAIVNDFYNQYINDLQPIQQLSPNCSAEVMESIGGILPAPQPTSINDFMVDYHEQVRRVGQLLSNSSNLSKKCLQEVVQAQGQS